MLLPILLWQRAIKWYCSQTCWALGAPADQTTTGIWLCALLGRPALCSQWLCQPMQTVHSVIPLWLWILGVILSSAEHAITLKLFKILFQSNVFKMQICVFFLCCMTVSCLTNIYLHRSDIAVSISLVSVWRGHCWGAQVFLLYFIVIEVSGLCNGQRFPVEEDETRIKCMWETLDLGTSCFWC